MTLTHHVVIALSFQNLAKDELLLLQRNFRIQHPVPAFRRFVRASWASFHKASSTLTPNLTGLIKLIGTDKLKSLSMNQMYYFLLISVLASETNKSHDSNYPRRFSCVSNPTLKTCVNDEFAL